MNLNIQNFELWFAKPLRQLFADEHAGFPILMISLPLLERYIRQKSGCHETDLDARAYRLFQQLFELSSEEEARKFWQIYRNGLLHQATFSKANRRGEIMPTGSFIADAPDIKLDREANIFYVTPKNFTEKVLQIIESDFSTFEAKDSPNHLLAGTTGGQTITTAMSASIWPST